MRIRIATLLAVPLFGVLTALPAHQARAQISIKVDFGTHLGPEIGVFAFDPARHGDWRVNYMKWNPVTLYDVNGHYYAHNVAGARPVVVYTYKGEYFFPPRDKAWINFDRRFDYAHRPIDADYGRVRPYAPGAVVVADPRLGEEIGVVGFGAARMGDWHANYMRWTPVVVYDFNGHYYPNPVPGARAVAMYRFKDEYFLPPRDKEWVGFDKRFDYAHRPGEVDYGRVRVPPR